MTNTKLHTRSISIGIKINDLGWPWRAIAHYFKIHAFSEPTRKIWM